MMHRMLVAMAMALWLPAWAAMAAESCKGYGPQSPRNLGVLDGTNPVTFDPAPPPEEMNLCNIRFTVHAEHMLSDVSIRPIIGKRTGWRCDISLALGELERDSAPGPFKGAKPGDTVEAHWVYTTCDSGPGQGMAACLPEGCTNPQLRIEAQSFLVVNNTKAPGFDPYTYDDPNAKPEEGEKSEEKEDKDAEEDPEAKPKKTYHQPKALPNRTGTPIVYLGATTDPRYSKDRCSPHKVTWSVRPRCQRVNIHTLHRWVETNPFGEIGARKARKIVTKPAWLSPIE